MVMYYLSEQTQLSSLSLECLTLKLCMLFLLAMYSRHQGLCSIKRSNIKVQRNSTVAIITDGLQKHSSRGKNLETVTIKPFPQDRSVRVVNSLLIYMHRTNEISSAGDPLLCSFAPPCKGVGTQTLARWIKKM